jgi:hypothetical protein
MTYVGDGLVQQEESARLHGEWIARVRAGWLRQLALLGATRLIASPRSQQELRLKPTTLLTHNQRGQLARVQIVVVDRRTPSALRKDRPAARADLLIRSATRCQQGFSQLRVKDSMIKNGALRRHTATLCSDTRRLSLRLPVGISERICVSSQLSTTCI